MWDWVFWNIILKRKKHWLLKMNLLTKVMSAIPILFSNSLISTVRTYLLSCNWSPRIENCMALLIQEKFKLVKNPLMIIQAFKSYRLLSQYDACINRIHNHTLSLYDCMPLVYICRYNKTDIIIQQWEQWDEKLSYILNIYPVASTRNRQWWLRPSVFVDENQFISIYINYTIHDIKTLNL